jgi:hypothetical protein
MKDVNKLVVALLKELSDHPAASVGDRTVEYLKAQTADARVWPTDAELRSDLPSVVVYGNIKQHRIRTIFAGIELQLRSDRHEDVGLPTKLEIEHIMPQGWRAYWTEGMAFDLETSSQRDRLVNTIGNLTLITKKLNVALSNRPWTDVAAQLVAPSGKDAGLGKRSLVNQYSVLLLNKDIVDKHDAAWTEADIRIRSVALAKLVAEAWPSN